MKLPARGLRQHPAHLSPAAACPNAMQRQAFRLESLRLRLADSPPDKSRLTAQGAARLDAIRLQDSSDLMHNSHQRLILI